MKSKILLILLSPVLSLLKARGLISLITVRILPIRWTEHGFLRERTRTVRIMGVWLYRSPPWVDSLLTRIGKEVNHGR